MEHHPGHPAAVDIAAVQIAVPELATAQRAAAAAPRTHTAATVTVLDPPHISLGYPWGSAPDDDLLRSVAPGHLPLRVDLGPPQRFPPDRRGRVTLYVPVRDGGVLGALAADLGWSGDVLPHCSLVRTDDRAALEQAAAAALPHVPPAVMLTTIEVTVRVRGRWRGGPRWSGGDGAGSTGRKRTDRRS